MKRNRASASAFFNPRILAASVLCSLGVLLTMAAFGMNFGILAFGVADVNLITGAETNPRVTQNSSSVWGHGNTVVAAYNDTSGSGLSPLSLCGVSRSTDGGVTFTRLPYKFNTGGTCLGSPSVSYSVRAAKWFAAFVAGRCGGNGIGQWASLDGMNWTNGSCVFSSPNAADLPSLWVDNNSASPFYGRQYTAFNNFDPGFGAVQGVYSTDDGVTWSAPSTLFVASFRRAWKVIGSLGVDGTVFVQTVDEGGGGLNQPRQNFIHRSTDGGVTWSAPIAQGPTFLGPGRVTCGQNSFFTCMYTSPSPSYWPDNGWGEPAAGPGGVVHYAYSAHGAGADPGDILYVRSTDNGLTWPAPLKLNTDATTRAQWSPSLSVNASGQMLVSWYDERNTTTDALERFGRASLDNGATWGTEMALSDVIFPKPLQPDPAVSSFFAGLFNRTAFSNDGSGGTAYHAWTDGRVSINGSPQQDVFFDKVFFPGTLTVTTLADHNDGTCDAADCTLREAINTANASAGSIIDFAPGVTGTIQLASVLPNLSSNVALQGPGANVLTVRRNTGGDYRIFNIAPASVIATISGLTIANGNTNTGGSGNGGGISNLGTLTLTNATISGNTANGGGNAGGILNSSGTLTIINSTISGNSATGGTGGGIWNFNGTVTITNSTISGNSATEPNFGIGVGGGIVNQGGTVTLTNSTISGNTAELRGGGIRNTSGSTVRAKNTIIALNTSPSNPDVDGAFASDGHNFIGNGTGATGFTNGVNGDQVGTNAVPLNPQLDTLGNYGGPTQTRALLNGSGAINAGDDLLAPPTDQRGYLRSGVSDIGAFEFGGIVPPTPTPSPTPTSTPPPPPTPTPTPTPTATPTPGCENYVFNNSSGNIVPGTTDIGNHTDDGETVIALPFPVTLYGNTYNSASAGSNGYLSFASFVNNFYTGCLPNAGFTYTIFPFETDQVTFPAGRGIFTLTTGITPFRTFYIEWRNCLYATPSTCIAGSDNNYEIVFQEGVSDFSIVYGNFGAPNNTLGAIGVQGATGAVTQLQCNLGPPANSRQTYGLCPPTPTPTPAPPVNISGNISYCSNPSLGPVPNVTLSLTGTMSGSTSSDASGNYTFSSLPSGGNYTVTPTKAARTPGSAGIDTVDVIATQRHFLNLGTPLAGCKLTAADVNGSTVIDTVDVIAVQRFFLGITAGIASVGRYQFTPVSRSYSPLTSNQIGQNYDALVFGDVASSFVHRPEGANDESVNEASVTGAEVALPEVAADQLRTPKAFASGLLSRVESESKFIAAVTTSAIDAKKQLVGFQGDFTFDERVATFQSEPVQKAGLTGGNWNVSANVLPGTGPIRTLRISAYSNDFTPLSGSGTLFELRMTRVSKAALSTQLIWAAPPDHFIFIDADLKTQKPGYAASGSVTQSGERK